jgi:hypothetical protein
MDNQENLFSSEIELNSCLLPVVKMPISLSKSGEQASLPARYERD